MKRDLVIIALILTALITIFLLAPAIRGIMLLILLFSLIFWQRKNLIKPEYNNKILSVLILLCIGLFFNALHQGGGEPIGLKALKEIAGPKQEIQKNPYYESMKGFISPQSYLASTEKQSSPLKTISGIPAKITSFFRAEAGTWFWWWLWFYFLLAVIIYIPFAFWDEIKGAIDRELERQEQRTQVIDLRPPVSETAPPAGRDIPVPPHQTSPYGNWFQRFRERVAAAFSADMLWDLAESMFRKFFGKKVFGR